RERGPRAVLDLRNGAAEVVLHDQLLPRRHVHRVLADLDADAELAERGNDRDEIPRLDGLDRHVAAGDRGHADEAADLDVVAADRPLAAAEALHAVDAENVRLD